VSGADAPSLRAARFDSAQAALAGLAVAIGLPSLVYPGFAGRAARKRVTTVGSGGATPQATGVTDAVTGAAVRASIDGAAQASMSAATYVSHHAAS
jgi:hypothetical protein